MIRSGDYQKSTGEKIDLDKFKDIDNSDKKKRKRIIKKKLIQIDLEKIEKNLKILLKFLLKKLKSE